MREFLETKVKPHVSAKHRCNPLDILCMVFRLVGYFMNLHGLVPFRNAFVNSVLKIALFRCHSLIATFNGSSTEIRDKFEMLGVGASKPRKCHPVGLPPHVVIRYRRWSGENRKNERTLVSAESLRFLDIDDLHH